MTFSEYLTEFHSEQGCPCWQRGGCADEGGCGGCCKQCPRCLSFNVHMSRGDEEPIQICSDCGHGT